MIYKKNPWIFNIFKYDHIFKEVNVIQSVRSVQFRFLKVHMITAHFQTFSKQNLENR